MAKQHKSKNKCHFILIGMLEYIFPDFSMENIQLSHFHPGSISNKKKKNQRTIGFAISVDCQFGNAANMFSNFLTIIANLDFC
jgi:hypothetical protein